MANKSLEMWDILAEGTLVASVDILCHKGIDPMSVDAGALSEALKSVLKEAIPQILQEWEGAIEGHMSEGWLRQMVNAQANECALKALEAMGAL